MNPARIRKALERETARCERMLKRARRHRWLARNLPGPWLELHDAVGFFTERLAALNALPDPQAWPPGTRIVFPPSAGGRRGGRVLTRRG